MSYNSKLTYVYDPMCSWCWGYAPTWLALKEQLQDILDVEYRVGGLAPDSSEPMPANMQSMLEQTWHTIADKLGTEFNYNFWRDCQPRRSTYPACRATLLARKHNKEPLMIAAIQTAYYLHAKNPSDTAVLAQLAEDIGLAEATVFEQQLKTAELNLALIDELEYIRGLPVTGFPSLVLHHADKVVAIRVNYTEWQQTKAEIMGIING